MFAFSSLGSFYPLGAWSFHGVVFQAQVILTWVFHNLFHFPGILLVLRRNLNFCSVVRFAFYGTITSSHDWSDLFLGVGLHSARIAQGLGELLWLYAINGYTSFCKTQLLPHTVFWSTILYNFLTELFQQSIPFFVWLSLLDSAICSSCTLFVCFCPLSTPYFLQIAITNEGKYLVVPSSIIHQ